MRLLLLLAALFVHTLTYGQRAKTHVLTSDEAKIVKKDASTMFLDENYEGALAAYKELYKTDQKNVDYNFKLGYCYLHTSNKKAAVPYLEYAALSKDAKKEWLYFLGQAYMYNHDWDEAVQAFSDFKATNTKMDKEAIPPDRMIEICKNGQELTANVINCKFTNLGKTVNTPFEEYNPFISADNNTLVFTSRRKGNMGGFIEELGIYTADIFSSLWKDTIWTKARSMGANVNTEWDEESVGLSPAGDQVTVLFDNSFYFGDVGTSSLKGKMWQKPVMFPPQVNSKQFEGGATTSIDGNTVYFSSERKEGSGKKDLWMCKKENGQWGEALEIKELNTSFEETNPVLSLDGKKLFFASNGWNTMGGFDIFYSVWDEVTRKWMMPVNLGYPLNDADDNTFISFTGDERYAYISAVRPEGFGGRDIYQVEFLDTLHHPFSQIITGTITGSSGRIEITKIILENNSGKQLIYQPTSTNNIFALPVSPGEYTLKIEGYNFVPYSETITVENDYPPVPIKKAIQLTSAKK